MPCQLAAKYTQMSEPRRHHYLARSYQKRFTDDGTEDGQLWRYDIEKREMRQLRPVNTAVEKEFNTLTFEDGTKDRTMESILCEFEGAAVPIIDKLERREPLTMEERDRLAHIVAVQRVRGPSFAVDAARVVEFYTGTHLKMLLGDPARAAVEIKRYQEATGESLDIAPEKLSEFVASDRFKVIGNRNASLRNMLSVASPTAGDFQQMDWQFCYAPAGSEFITSDQPFHIVPPPEDDGRPSLRGVGHRTPGTRKVFPLSPRVCLVMFDKGEQTQYADTTAEAVRSINVGIAYEAFRFVIGRNEGEVRAAVGFLEKAECERGLRWGGGKLTMN